MHPLDALQVILIAHADDAKTGDFPRPETYIETLRAAFSGWDVDDTARNGLLADPPKFGASVRHFLIKSADGGEGVMPPIAWKIGSALHSLVLVIVTEKLTRDDACVHLLEKIAIAIQEAKQKHDLLILGMNEAVLSALRAHPRAKVLKSRQGRSVESLTEYALRPAYVALLALHRAHRLMSADPADAHGAASTTPARARFFISHSKLDGLSLAHSMRHTIEKLEWLGSFYDARDILPGDAWQQILEDGVHDSMLLVLRTDIYDQRFWCRQEVMWAEQFDRPVLLIDARTQLLNRPSVLGFTGVPSVRIPDGNLVRVLTEGLREWVRIGMLRSRYGEVIGRKRALEKKTEFLSRPPGLASLVGALERLKKKKAPADAMIVHSEPALESGYSEAAQTLIRSHFANGAVLSFQTFLARLP